MEPDAAIQEAWAAYRPDAKWPLKAKTDCFRQGRVDRPEDLQLPDVAERAAGGGGAGRCGTGTCDLVWIYDMADPVAEKRGAQVALIFGRLFPKGYSRETFAGRKANSLDAARIDTNSATFIERGRRAARCARRLALARRRAARWCSPAGSGCKELGKPEKPDADTLYMIASNTKAMTTMLLGRLVDSEEGHVDDAGHEAPAAVQARGCRHHEQGAGRAPDLRVHRDCRGRTSSGCSSSRMRRPRARSPRSGRCSRRASSARCSSTRTRSRPRPATSGGTCSSRTMELGAAYDRAMAAEVFGPLGMKTTTFDFARALRGNHAVGARARHRRQARARGDGRQLLDPAGAAGRRRLEQRQRTS